MAIALHPDDITEFVPSCDRELPAEQQTVFMLKPIPAFRFARISEALKELQSEGAGGEQLERAVRATLEAGLCGWRNFLRSNGEAVAFATEGGIPTEDTFSALSFDLAQELFEAILERNSVNPAKAGN